ncbi:DUF2971 domain-containing protein [Citrobacter amalonaticus]|uniref:DUF2971 domain-containing protein n=1 Tax=Citrobacter amalonaticus TaxID=35703 RepID=UPI000E1A381A|nr:DUF2971 domain-containing protein [Citrobacter amalonaticus]MDL5412321.1 DUF2971 domain-containing protein [Citrobacter amalonaticus]MDS4039401.1 DUF2971 domain-containing protein [Citrobacter amalonaticus]QZA37481.1 DUF2971 domain-containing protein [Citrobacter amalonaticus]UBI22363.1 DUF2971 domain-containing protein [Citrobacter amalonaticus]SUX65068.1 Protein of uncharacterised function (DUF2971) [Citrobacter amalonaticus]
MANKPEHLYKYLTFSENTLNLICMQQAYYSDPSNFNDPLDCQPIVVNDLQLSSLRSVCSRIILKKAEKQFANSLKKLKFPKEKTAQRAYLLANSEVEQALSDFEYSATEFESIHRNKYLERCYTDVIQDEIVNAFKKGVLCLSKKFNSPLMWSHYANQHKGLCIEYDMNSVSAEQVHEVIYGGSRKILTSEISEWLDNPGNDSRIKQVCLLTKSGEWRYESEWRIFSSIGLGNSLPPIKSIIFGYKCPDVTIYAVMKAMVSEKRKLKFWKMKNDGMGFDLKRELIRPDDYFNNMPCLYSDSELLFDLMDE